MKSAEVAMQDAVLLRQEIYQICILKEHQKEKKKITRAFIQDGGSLTGSEGQQRLEGRETNESSSRPRQPAQCSNGFSDIWGIFVGLSSRKMTRVEVGVGRG